MSDDLARYSPLVAIDVLDALVRGETPSPEEALRATIALALHGADHPDAPATVWDLEHLVLEDRELDTAALERAARVSTELRHLVGVH